MRSIRCLFGIHHWIRIQLNRKVQIRCDRCYRKPPWSPS